MGKGSAKERELVNTAEEQGWWAKRAGASGGGTKSESHDVIMAKDGHVLVVELKYRDPDAIAYVEPEEVEELVYVASQLGAVAAIGARWKRDTTFYGYYPETLNRTDSGKYRLHENRRGDEDFELPPSLKDS